MQSSKFLRTAVALAAGAALNLGIQSAPALAQKRSVTTPSPRAPRNWSVKTR